MSSPTIVHPATPAVWDNAPVLGNASWYIASGLAVLPVAHRDKRPRSGFRWGSVPKPQDVESIEALFTETPPTGVGIICGEPSGGLVVLDLDGKLLLENVLDACPALRDTWIVRTGRTQPGAGFHIFVRASGPTPTITGGAFHDDLGLDVKATGSYVVAAPSLHSSGRVYEWQQGIPEQIVDVGSTQSFLIALMRGLGITLSNDAILEQLDRAFASGHRTVAEPIEGRIPESIRNKTLTSLAGSMRRRGASVKAILAALKVENASRCDPPLEVSEVRRIAASIGRYAPSGDLPTSDPHKGFGVGQGSLPMPSLAELRDRHSGDVDWIVDGYLARGELIFLAGAGESLKSWIAAHLAAAIVGDFRWLGCFEVHAERVLFVEQERAGNLVYQLNRIGIAERVDLDRDGLRIIPPVPMPLSDPQAQMALE
ncbi:MAG: bifunctional DNA primase/polymerase, partial [Chloroflexi bacterium]|nr:bifunctional DNA primase/polymerase [Chloroflexota bacterium]